MLRVTEIRLLTIEEKGINIIAPSTPTPLQALQDCSVLVPRVDDVLLCWAKACANKIDSIRPRKLIPNRACLILTFLL